jgi:DNA-binding NtrC family response regulator
MRGVAPAAAAAAAPRADPAGRGVEPGGGRVKLDGVSGKATWNDVERRLIMETLLECHGNRGEVARKLGWGRSTLWRKMKQHAMD